MGGVHGAARLIEFKFSDFFSPLNLVSTYALLRRSEHWSPARFEEFQSRLLARLLRFCASEVPYYGSLFKNNGLCVEDIHSSTAMRCLRQLPVLNKETLRDSPQLFMARDAARFHPKPVATSGTTGTPLTIYWDRDSNVMELCSMQRLWRWAGVRVGQPFLDLRSRMFSDNGDSLVRDRGTVYIRNWKVNGIEFSSDLIDEGNVHQYYELLIRYRPCLVRGHPQSIQHLASLLKSKKLEGWRPKAVTTASEALYDYQRKEIESAWGVPVLDSYGLKEHNAFIAQCREGNYHTFPEYGILEILDNAGYPVGPGQEGSIVATGLHNYAQPLLRYNTGDRAIVGDGAFCGCRRRLPTVERIIGRIDDCIYTYEGKRYSGMAFAFFDRRGIKKARLLQDDFGTVTVELVVTSEFDAAERAALLDCLGRKVKHEVTFELKIVRDIVQETPGKYQFVVSRLKSLEKKREVTISA